MRRTDYGVIYGRRDYNFNIRQSWISTDDSIWKLREGDRCTVFIFSDSDERHQSRENWKEQRSFLATK